MIFSIATNSFAAEYFDCIKTQRNYALELGMPYQVFWKIRNVNPKAAAWAKIYIIRYYLKQGHPWVAFLDADVLVNQLEDFRQVERQEYDVFLSLGRSGRPNSGVIFVRSTPRSLAFFDKVWESRNSTMPPEDAAKLKYENSHVIHYLKSYAGFMELPLEWNNTYSHGLDDYFRHYTGPMANDLKRSFITKSYIVYLKQLHKTQQFSCKEYCDSPSWVAKKLIELHNESDES